MHKYPYRSINVHTSMHRPRHTIINAETSMSDIKFMWYSNAYRREKLYDYVVNYYKYIYKYISYWKRSWNIKCKSQVHLTKRSYARCKWSHIHDRRSQCPGRLRVTLGRLDIPINAHILLLANPKSPVHSLTVCSGIPRGIEYNDSVGGCESEAHSSNLSDGKRD